MIDWKDKYIELLEKHNEALIELSEKKQRKLLCFITGGFKEIQKSYMDKIKSVIENDQEVKVILLPSYKDKMKVEMFDLNKVPIKMDSEIFTNLEKVLNE